VTDRAISGGIRPYPRPPHLKKVEDVNSYLNEFGAWVSQSLSLLDIKSKTIASFSYDNMPPLDGPPRFVNVPNDPTYGQVICFNGVSTSGTDTGWYRLIPAGTSGGTSATIPAGGTTSQYLGKTSTADYAFSWLTPPFLNSTAGTAGQVLTKSGTANYAGTWGDPHYLTTGGTTSQVLAKTSGADYAASWVDIHQVPAGGTANQALRKTSTADYDGTWGDVHEVPAGGAAKTFLIKTSTSDYDATWGSSVGTLTADAAVVNGTITGTAAMTVDGVVLFGGTSSHAHFSSTAAYLGKPLQIASQTTSGTVGTAGTASALPANPQGYLQLQINGAAYLMPFYST